MRTNFITLTVGIALAGVSSALPTEDTGLYVFLSKRVVSLDNSCRDVYSGANSSYSRDASVKEG